MTAPTITSYSDTFISLSWTLLTSPANGNSDMTKFTLQWDNGSSGASYVDLIQTTSTTYTVNAVTGGTTYNFRVRQSNIYGDGAYSTVTTQAAIDVPAVMDIPTTSISSTTVKIMWTAPDSHSSSITAYDIQFEKSDGSFTAITSDCDGTDSTIRTNLYCQVPMNTIRSTTGMTVDELIVVKVRAQNAKGWGDYS